jgi:hypothetical protein
MRAILLVLLSLWLASPAASWSQTQSDTSNIGPDRSLNLNELVGVYKARHISRTLNLDRNWERISAEDILEIVQISNSEAYVRLHLEFDNGHECNIHGVSSFGNNTFTYHSMSVRGIPTDCTLTLRAGSPKLTISDLGQRCRIISCGARGQYDGTSFDLSARRKIRYLPVILNSPEYQEAMKERESLKR